MHKHIAIAALDVGTSKIKLGVYCPAISENIAVLGSFDNVLMHESDGSVQATFSKVIHSVSELLKSLGNYLRHHHIHRVKIGLCGHVSSLLEWDKIKNEPVCDTFTIWSDTTCKGALPFMEALTKNGGSETEIGTFLPPGTNWLLTKLLDRKAQGFRTGSIFLQVGDALFSVLTEKYCSHASSQVSICHQAKGIYASKFLDHIGIDESHLPTLDGFVGHQVTKNMKANFGLPDECEVYPAMGDYFASFVGLGLTRNEAFVLGNTSEIQGVYLSKKPADLTGYISIAFESGDIVYGSTNTGSNLINWFLENILKRKISTKRILTYSRAAANLSPTECPVFLPYIKGERAPFWDGQLTGSFLEVKAHHNEYHFFRAIMEGVAFARRQGLNLLISDIRQIKFGGGASRNGVWNSIRASILNKPLQIPHENELAIVGSINKVATAADIITPVQLPSIQFQPSLPRNEWIEPYEAKYQKFLNYQRNMLFNHE